VNKTYLIIGGIVAVVAVLFLFSRSQATASAAANQPGLLSNYGGGGQGVEIGTVLDATSAGLGAISNLATAFGSGSSGSNDPGLEDYSV
jgi:hypothetical protein